MNQAMRIEDHPTPWTDAVVLKHAILIGNMTRLEQELEPLARDLERRLRAIYDLVEGDADGTVDATPYEKLCNEVAGLTGITL